jgi:hypothetical protein
MGMSLHDRYYEPDDDGYPDDWDWKVEQYAFEMLEDEYNYREPYNWAEGLGECGYDDSIYPTPSHAPVEVIEKVSVYWYDIAFMKATEYYEENPYND